MITIQKFSNIKNQSKCIDFVSKMKKLQNWNTVSLLKRTEDLEDEVYGARFILENDTPIGVFIIAESEGNNSDSDNMKSYSDNPKSYWLCSLYVDENYRNNMKLSFRFYRYIKDFLKNNSLYIYVENHKINEMLKQKAITLNINPDIYLLKNI